MFFCIYYWLCTKITAWQKYCAMLVPWNISLTFVVCGDNVCNEEDGENCSTCPNDCGQCPLTAGAISAIVVVACAVVIFVLVAVGVSCVTNNTILVCMLWVMLQNIFKKSTQIKFVVWYIGWAQSMIMFIMYKCKISRNFKT